MTSRKRWFLFLLATVSFASRAQVTAVPESFRVLAFSDSPNTHVQLKVLNGSYTLTAYTPDSIFTMEYDQHDVHPTYTFDGYLRLNRAECDSIRLSTTDTLVMRAKKDLGDWTEERYYTGQLTLINGLLFVEAIVKTPYLAYLAGVVEAEGGTSPDTAYHKAQAVLARTWLFTNFHRYTQKGYNITDDQKSQAFKGIAHGRNANAILHAVRATADTVALYHGKLIDGLYHSNSGGQTVAPEQVWSTSLPYCRTVLDPFSLKASKATWSSELPFERWNSYWERQGVKLTLKQWADFGNSLPAERQASWTLGTTTVKIENVRRELGLRSSHFTFTVQDSTIQLQGRGFGHGVGMSQQGAMVMAQMGFTWKEILNFYFKELEFRPL